MLYTQPLIWIKTLLNKIGVYNYLKYSRVFRMYEKFFKPHVIKQHESEVNLYKSFLHRCNLIFDIGAYDGHKTAAFLEISDKIVSCEPDQKNFNLMNIRFRKNKDKVIVKNVAVSDQVGESTFYIHHGGSAFNTLNVKWKNLLEADRHDRWQEHIQFLPDKLTVVQTTTIDELINQYGLPDFIKIDVEGYERHVFMGLSQNVPCVSFECLLPEFKGDLLFILDKLNAFNALISFNVIYEEKLLFPEFVSHDKILDWITVAEIYSFDIVALSKR